jgi:hypothetical protein
MRIRDGDSSDPGWEKVGSGINIPDPQHCLWLTDPDADPGGPKTYGSGCGFEHWYFHHSSKIKSHKEELQNSRNHGFSYYFCLMMEGSGSVLVPNGSRCGSGRPKNIRPNTGYKKKTLPSVSQSSLITSLHRTFLRRLEEMPRQYKQRRPIGFGFISSIWVWYPPETTVNQSITRKDGH